jgi:hypothetical protein
MNTSINLTGVSIIFEREHNEQHYHQESDLHEMWENYHSMALALYTIHHLGRSVNDVYLSVFGVSNLLGLAYKNQKIKNFKIHFLNF